jgi:hypothetical protein
MKRNGRPEDPVFEPTEKLFRRYKRQHVVGGAFSGVGLSFKDAPSLNREKYSQPQDVLFSETDEFANWGVLSFQVQHIPPSFPPEHPQYTLFPKHTPLEDNYSHTELYCVGTPSAGYIEPGPAVRKLLRAALSQKITVEIEARA